MKSQLKNQIKQLAETIHEMDEKEIDIHSLLELDGLLDLLNKKIKSTNFAKSLLNESQPSESDRFETILIFDASLKVFKYTGAFEHLKQAAHKAALDVTDLLKFENNDQFLDEVAGLIKDHKPRTITLNVQSEDGISLPSTIKLELISRKKGNEMIFAGINFTSTSLVDIQKYQQIIIENLPDIDVYLFDTEYRYVLVGGREKQRFGLSNSDFVGKTLFEAFDEKIHKRLFPFYRKAISGEMADGEIRIEDQVYYIWATPVLNYYDELVGGTAIIQNVTKDKEVEKRLKKAKNDAQNADMAKSVFLANMSHEIRTPLNAIIGFSDQLVKTKLNRQQQRFVELIDESSEHLLYLVNEILILFKLGMGKVFIDNGPFSIIHVLNSIYDSAIIKANEQKLQLLVDIDHTIPETLVGDSFRLKQVLSNLLSNALKYTDSGSVKMRCLMVHEDESQVLVRFEVQDTGVGISPELLPTIFEEFTQSTVRIDKQRKGAGLGLAISKKLVDLLGGAINVESEQGEGSTFTVELPFEKAREEDVAQNEIAYSLNDNLLKGKKILFADDDSHNLLLAETILRNWQTDYQIAKDGKEALEILSKEEFEIALIDIHMPEMSGMEVVRAVRESVKNPNYDTIFLAITANVLKSDIRAYIDSGFNDFLLKPFKEQDIYNKVCNVLIIPNHHAGYVEPGGEDETAFSHESTFNTENLKDAAKGDVEFYNQMISTFINNTTVIRSEIEAALKEEDWAKIGEKAHRSIPSFKYFSLNNTVEYLEKIENLALRKKEFADIPKLTDILLKEIEGILHEAQEAMLNT